MLKADYITHGNRMTDISPVFRKQFNAAKPVESALLTITALGVYDAVLNGKRVSDYVLAPGWTAYEKRLQYQTYDITALLQEENDLQVTVGKGWFSSPMPGFTNADDRARRMERPRALLGEICIKYADGSEEVIPTDASWEWAESPVRFSEIYDGEIYDATVEPAGWKKAEILEWTKDILIPQEGEEIREIERVLPKKIIHTPAGETVVDFGQEITGYVEICLDAKAGDQVEFLHGEVLDQQGNFYNANYRTAKAHVLYICKDGQQTYHPVLTFFGFRYIKLVQFPGEPSLENFAGIVVCSDIRQTGYIRTENAMVNQLISNIFWGQKGNFLDVPTDCPQRDERLGWTGDAQVFVKTASYNYDVEKFFFKWLHDMAAEQREDGGIGQVIPDYLVENAPSAAWGDAAVICPWQIYQTYGNPQILADQFECMKKWVDYIGSVTTTPDLWTGGWHFGDWLGLDAPVGSYKGSTRDDFIASAFYAYSAGLVVKAGKILGKDVSAYEALKERVVAAFRKTFPEYTTQTEHILAVHFGLAEDPQKTADALASMIWEDGTQMRTGFVGTPYLLHVLSEYGHGDLAYDLFLRTAYPSWLYSVSKGATTIWEHWDGIMEDGSFWSTDMNSFNHYAYGSVADWLYEKAAGIRPIEDAPGFSRVLICPMPDERLGGLEAEIHTRNGLVRSVWRYVDGQVRYEVTVEMPAVICVNGIEKNVEAGKYTFWG